MSLIDFLHHHHHHHHHHRRRRRHHRHRHHRSFDRIDRKIDYHTFIPVAPPRVPTQRSNSHRRTSSGSENSASSVCRSTSFVSWLFITICGFVFVDLTKNSSFVKHSVVAVNTFVRVKNIFVKTIVWLFLFPFVRFSCRRIVERQIELVIKIVHFLLYYCLKSLRVWLDLTAVVCYCRLASRHKDKDSKKDEKR
jgi:hypothetical protein